MMNETVYLPASLPVSAKEISPLLLTIQLVTKFIHRYILGAVIIFGIGGNILSVVIFWRCRRKDQITVTYLAPLAVADLGSLIWGAYSWVVSGIFGMTLGNFFIEPPLSIGAQLVCKIFKYQYQVCTCISAYLIVMFSLERCLGVWLPMKIHIIATKGRRKCLIVLMMMAMLLLNIPILVYHGVHYWAGTDNLSCFYDVPDLTNTERYLLIQYSENILPFMLPCLLILVLNILIITGVWAARKEAALKAHFSKNDTNSLISLLFISLLYLITTLPFVTAWGICDYFNYIAGGGGFVGWSSEEVQLLLMLALFTSSFSMINFCINFLIYASSLKIFRDELKRMCTVFPGRTK
jgi:hypothetical protein